MQGYKCQACKMSVHKRCVHYIRQVCEGHPVSVVLCISSSPYSVIVVSLTGLPIRYSVIVALTGLPIGYSVIGASLSEPHTSESPPQILVLSTMHKKLRQKSDNLRVRREFNGVDYSAFLYGSCNRPCHDK